MAERLSAAGFPDDYIGAILMHHYHDQGRESGASVEVIRDSGENFGLVVRQPSGQHYPAHIDAGQPARIEIPDEGAPENIRILLPEEES